MPRWIILILFALVGCASQRSAPDPDDIVFIVAGVGGGNGYGGLSQAVSRPDRVVKLISWGAPPPMFFMNFSTQSIHDDAETMMAKRITDWRQAHPNGRIDLIGHSAGGGVVLGALPRLGPDLHIHNVILLAPSVSPTYDLRPALPHVDGVVHVFHSNRDTTFLDWRTSHFGTYDRVKTKAAGNTGLSGDFPPEKVIQHPYDQKWKALGNDGGHFGTLSKEFDTQVIVPLLHQ